MESQTSFAIDRFTVRGEITDEAISVRTPSGAVRRLAKSMPVNRRALFFEALFSDLPLGGSSDACPRALADRRWVAV